MRTLFGIILTLTLPIFLLAQENSDTSLSQEEFSVIQDILQKEQNEEPETTAQEDSTPSATCLTVAYIDIEQAFLEHPQTIAIKKEINEKIEKKEYEVNFAKKQIKDLALENNKLSKQLSTLKPFYEQISTQDQALAPKIEEKADSLEFNNLLNQLLFSRADVLSDSPLNTPHAIDDITTRIKNNQDVISKNNFFIDNYKYTTKEEILALEKKEVGEILKDIYNEIKTFAKNRNIGAIVKKEDILYGENAVNVTKDFINHLKKNKKYHKRGK